jgi:hypothetical protein
MHNAHACTVMQAPADVRRGMQKQILGMLICLVAYLDSTLAGTANLICEMRNNGCGKCKAKNLIRIGFSFNL